MWVIGEVVNGCEVVCYVVDIQFDVILMDIQMFEFDGVKVIQSILEINLQVCVIMIIMYCQDCYVFEVVKVGVCGYIFKDVDVGILIDVIMWVVVGEVLFDVDMVQNVFDDF